jgi:hypothetical protein
LESGFEEENLSRKEEEVVVVVWRVKAATSMVAVSSNRIKD